MRTKLLGKHRARIYHETVFSGDRFIHEYVEVGEYVIWVLAIEPKSPSAAIDKLLSESLDSLKFDK
jgi:hypothetical protein